MKVYVVESGDYEQAGVDFVASSTEHAVEGIRQRYEKHSNKWERPFAIGEITADDWGSDQPSWSVVVSLANGVVTHYRITEWEVDGADAAEAADADD